MSVITAPGFYRQRNGYKAEVFAERDGWWYGRIREAQCEYESWSEMSWTASGLELGNPPMESDHDITGPWIDEPDPGEGWRLLEPHEAVEKGDQFYDPPDYGWSDSDNWWCGSKQQAKMFRYRRRIEKPFTISEHGCGVYETRNGNEQRIAQHRPGGGMLTGPSFVWVSESLHTYRDDGRYIGDKEDAKDLVRYLRPLDEPRHEWKPTCELRWCKSADANIGSVEYVKTDIGQWNFADLEQKWVCGDKAEWRPVEVQQ